MNWPPFHPEASQEFDLTVDYLSEIAKPFARRFIRRTSDVIEILRQFPESGSPLGQHTRRFPIRPFSYDLVYTPIEGDIMVIAIAHHKRRPGYWRSRLR